MGGPVTVTWLLALIGYGYRDDRPEVRRNFPYVCRRQHIVIGTGQFRKTARVEADLIASRRLMSNLELLRAWCVTTPPALFPDRKLGRLADGFDASFLALGGNPLADFARSRDIVMRVKQGRPLVPGDAKLPSLGG